MTLVSTVSVPHPASSRYPARAGAAVARQAPSATTAANPVLLLFMTPPPDRGLPVPTPLLADPPPVRERSTRATGHGSGCARTTTCARREGAPPRRRPFPPPAAPYSVRTTASAGSRERRCSSARST